MGFNTFLSLRRTLFLTIFLLILGCNGYTQITVDEVIAKAIDLHEVTPNDSNYDGFDRFKSILKNVDIVMLGEESHHDGATLDTKVKLVKYLHKNLEFDILAFEGGFYECKVAWDSIENGSNAGIVLGKTLVDGWGVAAQLKPLTEFISEQVDTKTPLMVLGFDSQFFNKTQSPQFRTDLKEFLQKAQPEVLNTPAWSKLEAAINAMSIRDFKALKKMDIAADTVYLNTLTNLLSDEIEIPETPFWMQNLKNLKCFLSDIVFGMDCRDRRMAENLVWIHENYPDKKIICWGATSHFLYNSTSVRAKSLIVQILGANSYKKSPMMGAYLKNKYGDQLYTIGFTAYSGKVGFGTSGELKPPKKKSLEYLLAEAPYANFFIPLQYMDLSGYIARPLGYFYIKTDLSTVMDGLIFNRTMTPVRLNVELYNTLFPDNQYYSTGSEQ